MNLVLIVLLMFANPVAERDSPGRPAADSTQAAGLHFDAGVSAADRMDFETALAEFRQAYDLSPRFEVLFNTALALHALRRNSEAVEVLNRYLREGGDLIAPERQAEVKAMIATWDVPVPRSSSPPAPAPAAVAKAKIGNRASSGSVLPLRHDAYRTWSRITGVAALTLAATSVALWVWNERRHDRWKTEDGILASAVPTSSIQAEQLEGAQRDNDALSKSIHKVDIAAVGMMITGAALAATAYALNLKGTQMRAAENQLRFAWSW